MTVAKVEGQSPVDEPTAWAQALNEYYSIEPDVDQLGNGIRTVFEETFRLERTASAPMNQTESMENMSVRDD